jgi:acetyl-CoA C-acetyltransferase
MCGSGMQAAILAHDGLLAGTSSVTVAGGMESMSNAPYLLAKVRTGQRMGHGALVDHMFLDGLEDAYEPGRAMGTFAEDTARHYGFSRDEQDAFAARSLERAQRASTDGSFAQEIVAVEIRGRKAPATITSDEQPRRSSIERISQLRPAFARDGTVTAANSSSISDGAAAVVLMRRSEAERRGIEPLATIRAHAVHAQEPRWFTTAPVQAIRSVLERAGWETGKVDLYEINEAFAVVVLAAMRDLGLVAGQVNVRGGACALGHPIGASGARIVVTLVSAMMAQGLRRGVAALCIGGGEATALAIERDS